MGLVDTTTPLLSVHVKLGSGKPSDTHTKMSPSSSDVTLTELGQSNLQQFEQRIKPDQLIGYPTPPSVRNNYTGESFK